MNLPESHYHLVPTRPDFFWSRSSPQNTLRSPFIFDLILREIEPENHHEFHSLEFMVNFGQKTPYLLRALAGRARDNGLTFRRYTVGWV